MNFWRLKQVLLTDLKRAVTSWGFMVGILGVAGMMLMAIGGMETQNASVWYLMDLSIQGSGTTTLIFCILPVFAFGISYASEWMQKAERFWMVRTGVNLYVFSKVAISFLSGFLVVFIGIALFAILLLPFFPIHTFMYSDSPYELLADQNMEIIGMLLYMIHHGITGGLTSVCSMWFSSMIPDPFAAAAAPLVLYFFLFRITGRLPLPAALDPINWNSGMYYADTAGETIIIKIGISLALCVIMGVLAGINVRRRLLHE